MALNRESDWEHFWLSSARPKTSAVSWSKQRVMALLGPYLQKGQRALDAGCGSGFFSKFFFDCGLETVAVDYSDQALTMVKQRTGGGVAVVKMDLLVDRISEKIEMPFDLIFSDGLFEHFSREEQIRILNNLLSILNKSGVLITVVPNRFSPWQILRPFYMPGIKENPFESKDIENLYLSCGMKIYSFKGINVFPFRWSPEKHLGNYFGMLYFISGGRETGV